MYDLLTNEEKENIKKIQSRLHGTEYLSRDLKLILEELSSLINIENAIIILGEEKDYQNEFIGKAKEYW